MTNRTKDSTHPPPWNPYDDWRDIDVDWVRVAVSKDDLRRFTQRSDIKGLFHAVGFLLIVAATGSLSYFAFTRGWWLLMAVGLCLHGLVYGFFGDAIHELSHYTVFKTRFLSEFFTRLYGWLYWPWNPYFYRASHQHFHHRYTLYQNSDGEDTPNYIEVTPRLFFDACFRVFRFKAFFNSLVRLLTLKPTSMGWRGRGYRLDDWERFILEKSTPGDRERIMAFARFCLVTHVLFAVACIALGQWFLLVLITFAPLYGPGIVHLFCGIHQHVGCDANEPDFRKSCGSARLDPLSSFLYWRMEYHTEHHMFAGIPCYNLPAFSRFIADQMPPREWTLPRLLRMHRVCRDKFGSQQAWRDNYGRFKGF